MKRFLSLALVLLMMLSLTACGNSSSGGGSSAPASVSENAYYVTDQAIEAPAAYEPEEDYPKDSGADWSSGVENESSQSSLPDGVKMIYTANATLESTEFDQATADIAKLVEQLGGYFEQKNVENYSSGYRYAHYTVRVPADRFESFLGQMGNVCHVRRVSQNAENVSEAYFDTESRLKTAQTKLARLQELLAKAEDMADIITIEGAIAETEYQIESLSGELRHYDSLIGYSTIHIDLNEVYRITQTDDPPMTFAQRLSHAFRDGLKDFGSGAEDFAEWLAYNWLRLILFIAVLVLIIRFLRRSRARRQANAETTGKKKSFHLGRKKETPAPADDAAPKDDGE